MYNTEVEAVNEMVDEMNARSQLESMLKETKKSKNKKDKKSSSHK